MSVEEIKEMYDRQAGNYTKWAKENHEYNTKYCKAIAEIINRYNPNTICEAGVGEGTTLKEVRNYVGARFYGFDISPKRLEYAKINLYHVEIANMLGTGYIDNAFDIVYTSHSIEPNQGKEKEIVKELFRITKNYLILLEPIYQYASDEGKARMVKLGYITNLLEAVKKYNVIECRPFICYNKLNPTGLIVCKKS